MTESDRQTRIKEGRPDILTWCLVVPLMIIPMREIVNGSTDVMIWIPVIAAGAAAIIQVALVIRRRRDSDANPD
ncbi:hypothetical protein [Gordonia aurantiaca]|uniref:hypothetical protein n=1 Tax=Gordonia sp. B21 TaxID=3151852 RepID=UPI0032641201